MDTIYKRPEVKTALMDLYDARLEAIGLDEYETRHVETSVGKTHVILAGNPEGEPLVILHGIHAGAPMALEAVKDLLPKYRLVAVDTVGQATRSAETRLSMKDESYGRWMDEVLDGLDLPMVTVVGVSYGGFILQRLVAYRPDRIKKAIFIVPMGLVQGAAWRGFTELSIPLIRFMVGKRDKRLRQFLGAFYGELQERDVAFQRTLLLGVKMDFNRPPLMKLEEAQAYKGPSYLILADDDVFIPWQKAKARFERLFGDVRALHLLKGSKHIPSTSSFSEISTLLDRWAKEDV